MMKKCNGCGAFLQITNPSDIGYTKDIDNTLCERCFRIVNYNEYLTITKDNNEFTEILKGVSKTNDLVVLLVDVLNIPKNIEKITNNLSNDILLVYTKRDVLPLSINDDKILDYELNLKCIHKLIISSNKNYNFDLLYEKIIKYKKTNNVYIVGLTNSGKSTLINKFMHNYSNDSCNITTSNLPSTTLDLISIKVNDELTLIDTPGILDEGNIINYLDSKLVKKIGSKKEIKPITYQIRKRQFIIIENIVKIDSANNNLTFYMSNNLNIKRVYKDVNLPLKEKVIRVNRNSDIVITGLGFIKVNKNEKVSIWVKDGIDVYVRNSLI